MTIYGIKTCSTVGKARKHLNEIGLIFDFVNYRETPVGEAKVKEWTDKIDIDVIFNNKGKKYRDLELKKLNLDREDKIKWLVKENTLLKRPILELDNGEIIVGYKEDTYNNLPK